MKHGRNPTRAERNLIKSRGLNTENWFVAKAETYKLTLVHRHTGAVRVLARGTDET